MRLETLQLAKNEIMTIVLFILAIVRKRDNVDMGKGKFELL